MGHRHHPNAHSTPVRNPGSASSGVRRILITGTAIVALSAVTLLGAAACGGPGGSDDATSTGRMDHADAGSTVAESTDLDAGEPTDASVDGAGGDGPASVKADSVATATATATAAASRERVYTADLEMEVEVLEDSVEEAGRAVEANGGFAATEQVDLGDAQHATVTYRVPADRFRQAVDAITAVGDLRTQQVEGRDVTAEYADLEGRVTTLRTSIARLQGFLGEATDANQVALLEGELTRREAELESTESQRRALADQVDLSTITVTFTGSRAAAPLDETRTLPTYLGGLETGWDILVAAGAFVLSALGFLTPLVPLVVVVVLLVRFGVRRRRPAAV